MGPHDIDTLMNAKESVVDAHCSSSAKLPQCSLTVLTARCDVKFMAYTVPHIVRMCNYPFHEKVLHVDDPTIRGDYKTRPDIGSVDEHLRMCHQLRDQGVVDRVAPILYDRATVRTLSVKHFGTTLKYTHDVHGYPIHGSVFAIEDLATDYVVHFDCDMLLHSSPDFSWVRRGIELMQSDDRILFVSPRSGPPAPNGRLKQDAGVQYVHDRNAGCFLFETFTSRKFLVNMTRLAMYLPLRLVYVSWRRRLKALFTHQSPLWNWEVMISKHLADRKLVRADLENKQAWTLHTPEHGADFLKHLPQIIGKVEAGWFPDAQAGDYELRLEHWCRPSE